ncbi:MAG: DUF4012 domain-containing protein [Acidimicrobiales bacterium]
MPTPTLVFAAATAVAALCGWLSLRADRLAPAPDEQDRRRRRRRIPITGTVLAVATVAGALGFGTDRLDGRSFGLLAIAAALGAVGLALQHNPLRPFLRIAAESVAAVATVALGLRTGVTGTAVTNVVVVVVFLVVMVESMRLLDVGPRAAAGAVAPAAAALGVMAYGTGQDSVATLALALAGGLTGLLVVGTGRTFVLGEPGTLFGGFLLAALVVDVTPATSTPLSALVVLPVLTVPLLNAAVMVIDRLRRRRPLTSRRPDGLPHRLRTIPLPWGVVLSILGGTSALLAALAVLADRQIVPVATPVAGAAMAGIVLLATANNGKVHRNKAPGLSTVVRRSILATAFLAVALAVPAGLALFSVRGLVVDGAAAAERGLEAARRGEVEAAGSAFDQAEAAFTSAADRLDHPLATLGLAVPVLGPNLSAVRTLSGVGAELAGTGVAVTTAAPQNLTVSSGTVPVDEIRRLAPDLAEAATDLDQARTVAAGVERAYLLPALRDELVGFDARLDRASADAESAAQAAAVVPAILGGDETRRYFLAIQNNAELRATGGFLGNYGELVADNGSLRLDRIGRHQELNEAGPAVKVLAAPYDYLERYTPFQVASTWESVNLSPDFPTVASVMSGLYPQSGGQPVDGVIGIDPIGLSALLALTGPVVVESWPEAITAQNVVDITLNQAYVAFEDDVDERIDFLATVASATVDALRTTDLGSPARIVGVLGPAARGGHLSLWFTRPEEQALVKGLSIAGQVDPVDSDSLLVVNQNVAANKVDYYLRRTTSYDVLLRPEGDSVAVAGRLRVDMENQAPDTGLPRYVIGPFDERFEAGENRTFVSVYTPLALTGATWNGVPVDLTAAEELGRRVYSSFLGIPAQTTRTLELQLQGTVAAVEGGWYELDLLNQPLLVSEAITATFEVPHGWRIVEAEGAELDGRRRAVATVVADQDEVVRLLLEPQG